jgi:protocatechuate 3,4-dioxygenase beta subunit
MKDLIGQLSLQGTVEDSTGSAVSNAKVTLLNQDTQTSLQATSDAAGVYGFVSLAPGSYVVLA